ncbi:MAG: hypothetical protein K8L99_00145 [Anaerolineae bacterium]|nr:hypothetical protein [Anaerolineae bacterium]
MSKRYSPDHKALVMSLLRQNGGNTTLTSQQTGIPARTLRDWRQHDPAPLSPALPLPVEEEEDPGDEMLRLRQTLMRRVFQLAADLDADYIPARDRAFALTNLIDRILKLDTLIPRYAEKEVVIRFEYEDPQVDPFYNPEDADEEYDEPIQPALFHP